MKFKKADFIVFLLPMLLALVSAFFVFSQTYNPSEKIAQITVDGKTVRELSLGEDCELDLSLPAENIIVVRDGRVCVKDADCKDKTCEKTGWISRSGQVIVCVPSGLVIRIVGAENDYDVMVR